MSGVTYSVAVPILRGADGDLDAGEDAVVPGIHGDPRAGLVAFVGLPA